MPGLLNNFARPDPSFFEGFVGPVDLIRHTCQVKTINGQVLTGVQWGLGSGGSGRAGEHRTPHPYDRVVVMTTLGYPVIILYLPSVSNRELFPTQIHSGTGPEDTGNYSGVSNGLAVNPERPTDMHPGDKITTTAGGGLFGLLRGGTFIAKASRLAQIMITKYDDLVRIVGRNHEVFTDACINIYASIRGRIYRYVGYSNVLAHARQDQYEYEEFYGDTVAAEALKGSYIDATATSIPPANTVLRKVKVGNFMSETLDTSGTLVRVIGNTILTQSKDELQIVHDSATVTINESAITCQFGSNSTIIANGSEVSCIFGGHSMVIDSAGVHLS
jgi:hypothetical protein